MPFEICKSFDATSARTGSEEGAVRVTQASRDKERRGAAGAESALEHSGVESSRVSSEQSNRRGGPRTTVTNGTKGYNFCVICGAIDGEERLQQPRN